jgi:response regulator RpfG family c-di-GMP phosphodiesterase
MKLPRILYVDDEAINLELLQLTFMDKFDVITAESAEVGLRMLALDPDIHVIISDLRMPLMNGLDFIKAIKKLYQDKVCMLLTGFLETDVMLEGFNKELIFRYIMKPWNRAELEQSIHEALNR